MSFAVANTIGYSPHDNHSYEFEDCWELGDDYYTTDNLYWGMVGEKVVTSALTIKYKRKEGYTIEHNDFSSKAKYATGEGMDNTIIKNGAGKVARVEVKNLAEQDKPYGTDFVRRHVLTRAKGIAGLKLLVITFLNLLTKHAVTLLEENGWKIIEVGERLTYDWYKRKNIHKLYKLAYKLKSTINSIKPKTKPKHTFILPSILTNNYKQLTDYNNTNNITILNNALTKLHDTPLANNRNMQYVNRNEYRKLMNVLLGGHG